MGWLGFGFGPNETVKPGRHGRGSSIVTWVGNGSLRFCIEMGKSVNY